MNRDVGAPTRQDPRLLLRAGSAGSPAADGAPSAAAQAFDAVAERFDQRFGDWASVAAQRRAVRRHLLHAFPAGASLLELGGGTGEDALFLAERGRHVFLTDGAPSMVAQALRKIGGRAVSAPGEDPEAQGTPPREDGRSALPEAQGVPPREVEDCLPTSHASRDMARRGRLRAARVTLESLDAFALDWCTAGGYAFDGAFSNFAALNCVADLRPVASGLARLLRLGAPALLVVFGPFPPGEGVVQLARGRPGAAFRRLSRAAVPASLGGKRFSVYYPSPRELARAFAPWFRLLRMRGIGIFVPPSAAEPAISRFPRLVTALERLDRIVEAPLALLGDHVLLHFVRTATPVRDRARRAEEDESRDPLGGRDSTAREDHARDPLGAGDSLAGEDDARKPLGARDSIAREDEIHHPLEAGDSAAQTGWARGRAAWEDTAREDEIHDPLEAGDSAAQTGRAGGSAAWEDTARGGPGSAGAGAIHLDGRAGA